MTLMDNKKKFADWDSFYKKNNIEDYMWSNAIIYFTINTGTFDL